VGEPKVLLLDEPGVGVDPISRRELWQMVHELAGDGMLILWSTSYLDEAEQCRDVLLMNEGELLYQGEPTTLTQSMAGRSFLLPARRSPTAAAAAGAEAAAGQRRDDSGEIGARDPQKEATATIFARRRACRRLRLKRPRRALKMRLSTCWAARGPRNRRWARLCTRWKARRRNGD
jgi:ABC-type multidrug transport system ATPase subunit